MRRRRQITALAWLAASLLVSLVLSGGARAELVEVRQVAGGMECAECARQLRMDVGQLDGVNGTDASWNRRILTVRFRARNRATLEELRAVVRRHHFSVREAEVVVRGRVGRSPSGALQLAVTGSGAIYPIAASAAAPGATEALAGALARAATDGREVTLRGRIAGDEASPGREAPPQSASLWVLQISDG
jgi:hypothetical protein